MDKSSWLRWINSLLFFSVLLQATTVVIILLEIRTANPQLIFQLHKQNGMVLLCLIASHFYLNWGWVRANFLRKK